MSRAQPGAVILDQLRDRIVTGLYFGNWQPGERLPSIRDIADAEAVDRKTAAAAYHRLAEEGLVEVKARSGVFLRHDRRAASDPQSGPLEKLKRRWLRNTYDGARALGLDTGTVLRLFRAVAEVEATPIAVLEEDEATGRTVADELRACAGIDARAVRFGDVESRAERLAGAPFLVTTPYCAGRAAALLPRTPVVMATLSLEPLHTLMRGTRGGRILVVVPSEWIRERVESVLRQQAPDIERLSVVVADAADLRALRSQAARVFVWPGCDEVLTAFEGDDCVRPVRLLSEATIDRVHTLVLEAALRLAARISTSTAAAPLPATAARVG